ncbi:MAG: DUF1015 domain-containing protein, partial [Gammaproteobacteria bacterium]|nr:DUF1015 domain-containing protein [Gammaproteobacteria bacterium]
MSTLIKPFRGLRPVPARCADVAAPPYDVLNTEEARRRAEGRPASFLHISKPEIDLPDGTDPHADQVYAKGAENLQTLITDGILIRDDVPCYYAYRLRMGEHLQTGLVGVCNIDDYNSNRIRKHEFTQPSKEDDRVRQITALNAQTGPVLLAYRRSNAVKSILDKVTSGIPLYDLVADDGIGHTVWSIDAQNDIDTLTKTFDAMTALYIADGHHRSAAASRVAEARNAANPDQTGDEAYNYFLCVAFPDDETQILDYNRVIKDLNGLQIDDFLQRIGDRFLVTPADHPARPAQPTQFGMYLDHRWYQLDIRPDLIPLDDPVASLDISLLQDHLIGPLL